MNTQNQDPMQGQSVICLSHWVKDLSLEMKNNLTVSIPEGETPKADVNLEIGATRLQRNVETENSSNLPHVYEVAIRVTINVSFNQAGEVEKEKRVSLVRLEAEVAGAFYINSKINEDQLDYHIYVKCAEQLLPYTKCYVDQAMSFSSIYEPISLKRMDINLEEMFARGKQSKADANGAKAIA